MTDTPRHASTAAFEFLRWLRPGGPWPLFMMQGGRTRVDVIDSGATGRVAMLLEYADRQKLAVYYLPADPSPEWLDRAAQRRHRRIEDAWLERGRPAATTPEKHEIVGSSFAWADVDPRAGEDLVEERSRILKLLTERRPTEVPAPDKIVDSGGGYQALWSLSGVREPKAVEEICYGIELKLGADACHNVNRLLRLPGSVNHPSAKKLKIGRAAALAQVVSHD